MQRETTTTKYADGRIDTAVIEEFDEHGYSCETHEFVRAGVAFKVTIVDGDGETRVHVAFTQDGVPYEERFGGYAARTVILAEARAYCAEVACPTERARYGTPEWEIEVEGEMIRAEEEAIRYGG